MQCIFFLSNFEPILTPWAPATYVKGRRDRGSGRGATVPRILVGIEAIPSPLKGLGLLFDPSTPGPAHSPQIFRPSYGIKLRLVIT